MSLISVRHSHVSMSSVTSSKVWDRAWGAENQQQFHQMQLGTKTEGQIFARDMSPHLQNVIPVLTTNPVDPGNGTCSGAAPPPSLASQQSCTGGRLVLGATPACFWALMAFFCLGKNRFVLVLDFGARSICNFSSTKKGNPGPWNSHGLTALENAHLEGEGGGFWDGNPSLFLTSLFNKDFWFMLNSTLLALPKAILSSGHTP